MRYSKAQLPTKTKREKGSSEEGGGPEVARTPPRATRLGLRRGAKVLKQKI